MIEGEHFMPILAKYMLIIQYNFNFHQIYKQYVKQLPKVAIIATFGEGRLQIR